VAKASLLMGAKEGATSLVDLILRKFGDDTDGAAKELERLGGFPPEVSQRIASGELPMDEASRVARREGRYADEGLVHVNRGGIKGEGFDNSRLPTDDPDTPFNAHWFTTDPHPSTAFRGQGSDEPLTYTPAVLEKGRRGDWRDVVEFGESPDGIDAGYGTEFREGLLGKGVSDLVVRGGDKIDQSTIDALPVDGRLKVDPDNKYGDRRNSLAKNDDGSLGYHEGSEHILDYDDLADYQRFNPEIRDVAVLDNTIIRSPNAAFDPQYKGSNIMGGAAGTAGLAGLLAAGQSEDSEAGFITKGGKTLLEAFHGSPHKFDKFSMDAIGTGEGAQAYGHGLYFADSEDLAKGYREALTEGRFEVNGKTTDSVYNSDIEEKFADEFNTAVDDYADDWVNSVVDEADAVGFDLDQDMLSDFVRSAKNDFEDDLPIEVAQYAQKVEEATGLPISDLAEELDLRVRSPLRLGLANMSQIGGPDDMGYVYDQLDDWGPFARDVFDRYIGKDIQHIKPEGALYRTEIDVTPESLLDYDMPLNKQPQSVQDAFVNAYRGHVNDGTPDGLLVSELLEGSSPQDALNLFDDSKGSQSYRTLAGMVGGEDKASALLNQQGVRGIKFADGNSRKAKQAMVDGKSGGFEGDENYVIFDDSLINIAERGNATVPLLGATALGTAGALAAPALMKDGVFQHSATKEPVVERREPVNNQSSLLEGVTDFADDVFTNFKDAAGPIGSLLMPFEGINDYLKVVNDNDKQPTWWDRLGLLDL
jgi:hypothetical protein